MKVNTKIRYGLRTIIEIASAKDPDGILQKDIAKNQDLSIKYLDTIITSLKLKGLIANSKGKGSGYKLARPMDDISMLDIYTAFEPITFVDCIDNCSFCDRSSYCESRDTWVDLRNETENLLKNKKLSQIVEKHLIKNNSSI